MAKRFVVLLIKIRISKDGKRTIKRNSAISIIKVQFPTTRKIFGKLKVIIKFASDEKKGEFDLPRSIGKRAIGDIWRLGEISDRHRMGVRAIGISRIDEETRHKGRCRPAEMISKTRKLRTNSIRCTGGSMATPMTSTIAKAYGNPSQGAHI